VDPHHGDADPFLFDAVADPDPPFQPVADPDPDPNPSFQIEAQTLEKLFK
jgi:hypothetical protein